MYNVGGTLDILGIDTLTPEEDILSSLERETHYLTLQT